MTVAVLLLWGDESGDYTLDGDESGDLILWGDEATEQDGGDGLTREELAALKRHLKQAKESERKRIDKRKRAERLLNEALETAWRKVFHQDVPPPIAAAVLAPEPVAPEPVAGVPVDDLASLRESINRALAVIAQVEGERHRQELADQEEEEIEMLLLAI